MLEIHLQSSTYDLLQMEEDLNCQSAMMDVMSSWYYKMDTDVMERYLDGSRYERTSVSNGLNKPAQIDLMSLSNTLLQDLETTVKRETSVNRLVTDACETVCHRLPSVSRD